MRQFIYEIKDAEGIHARPAGMLVKKAKEYQSSVTIAGEGDAADAKRIITVTVAGEDYDFGGVFI